jgi:hypothetical protein
MKKLWVLLWFFYFCWCLQILGFIVKIVVGVMFVYIFLWSNGLQILGWVVLACCLQDAI